MIFYQYQRFINTDCNPPFQGPSDPELLSFKNCHPKSTHTWMIHCFQATVRHQFQTAVRLLSYNMTADDGSIKVNIYILCLTDKPKTCYMFICGPLDVTPCSW